MGNRHDTETKPTTDGSVPFDPNIVFTDDGIPEPEVSQPETPRTVSELNKRDENTFVDYVKEIFGTEGGDNVLALKTIVIVTCESCNALLADPVLLLVNSENNRDSVVVCRDCTD